MKHPDTHEIRVIKLKAFHAILDDPSQVEQIIARAHADIAATLTIASCHVCGDPVDKHGQFGFRDHAPRDANGDEIYVPDKF